MGFWEAGEAWERFSADESYDILQWEDSRNVEYIIPLLFCLLEAVAHIQDWKGDETGV